MNQSTHNSIIGHLSTQEHKQQTHISLTKTNFRMSGKREWSELNADILQMVAECLKTDKDYIRVRSVCRSWRTFLPQIPRHRIPTSFPYLFIVHPFEGFQLMGYYYLTAPKTNIVCHITSLTPNDRLVGSSHGSFILISLSLDVYCYNPVTEFKASLPPLSTLPDVASFNSANVGCEYSIQNPHYKDIYSCDLREMRDDMLSKVVLSCSTTNDACVAIAIISDTRQLAYCKCGDSSWKSLPDEDFFVQDIIYCQSKELFYAVNYTGDVTIYSPPNIVEFIENVDYGIKGDSIFLVKSKGELLLVGRILANQPGNEEDEYVYKTAGFRVFKYVDAGKGKVHWESVTDLEDQMVFVGNNLSIALSASDYEGCKGNCIYYTDDHSQKADVGVYDLSNDHIESLDGCAERVAHYVGYAPSPDISWGPFVWLTPNYR